MLNSSSSSVFEEKAFLVPTHREGDVSTWGGLQPAYVTHLPKAFIWEGIPTKLNPAYFDLFKLLGLDPEYLLAYERVGYRAFECLNKCCDVGVIYRPIVRSGKYHPWASLKHSSRCVARVMPRLEFMKKQGSDYLICLDLTMLHDVRLKQNPKKTLDCLRRAINDFLIRLRAELFPNKSSKLGGFYAIHTWKTTKPLDFHFHVHLQLFNVALGGSTFYRFYPKLNSRKVRLAWKKSLVRFGFDDPLEGLPNVHLHYIKMTDHPRLVHRLRYVYRRPLEDLNKNLQSANEIDVNWVRWLLDYTPRQVFVGFAVKLRRLGLICPKTLSMICPICGLPMQKLDKYHDLPPDVPRLFQVKSNMWLQLPPDL